MKFQIKERNALATAGVIFSLAWPTMLEQILETAVQYIDTAMVGALGTQATAAVGSTTTINWLIFSTISAIGIGFLTHIAQACGANQREKAKQVTAQAVLVTLVVGICCTILVLSVSRQVPIWMQVDPQIQTLASAYFFVLYLPLLPRTAITIFGTVLRATGDTKTPMKVGAMVNLINIVLNFLLIYETRELSMFSHTITMPGAGWGVVGAAAASAVAFTIGGIWITAALWRHPMVSPRGYSIRPDWMVLRPCLRIAVPNMLQRFITCLGYVAFAAMINSLGEIAAAAHTIANTVESAFYIPGYGMQSAAATLTGNAYGARDRKRMESLASMFIPIEVGLMVLSGGALFLTAPILVSLFSKSAAVIVLDTAVLRMVAVSEPFFGLAIIIEGMMMGVGKTREPFLYNIIGMWGIRVAFTFVCTQMLGMGLVAAWACMIGHNLLLFSLYLIAYLRGTWNPLRMAEQR